MLGQRSSKITSMLLMSGALIFTSSMGTSSLGVVAQDPSSVMTAAPHTVFPAASLACSAIVQQLPDVIVPADSEEFQKSIKATLSDFEEIPVCVVQPSTAEELSTIIKLIGHYRSPFAVRSGGHANNAGFSSTTGVHISMARFNEIKLSEDGSLIDVGSGQTWSSIYDSLKDTGRAVVGGRAVGVGVGGFLTWGGGFSFLSSLHGLGVDHIEQYTLVCPNGTITKVTEASNKRLFNALKGTGNNFGIVTSFKLRTVELGPIWGGSLTYTADQFNDINAALATFSLTNNDNKAVAQGKYVSLVSSEGPTTTVLKLILVYLDTAPPAETFKEILAIKPFAQDPPLGPTSLLDIVAATSLGASDSQVKRAFSHTISLKKYPKQVLDAFTSQLSLWSEHLAGHSSGGALLVAEPFTEGAFAHASGLEAYAHDSQHPCTAATITFAFNSSSDDTFWNGALESLTANITAVAEQTGQKLSDCPKYPNYAFFTTPLEEMFGDQVADLQKLRREFDPDDVMGLTGGFRL